MKRFIQEIKENKLGFIFNLLIRLSIFYFLAEVMLFQDDPRFAGKAIPIRNLIIVVTLSLLFPFFHFIKKKWAKYPVWFDNLYLSIFWLDMAGNSLDLYDSYFYFDLFAHFHGSGAFAAFLLGAFNFSALSSILIANLIHGLLEGQEIFTDVFFGTHNVRGSFDTINDMIAGVLGTFVYAGLTYRFIKYKALKLKALVIILTVITLTTMFFHKTIAANFKTVLFISESFPQIEYKPLSSITQEPTHSKFELDSKNGKVAVDLFTPKEKYTPKSKKEKPAIIIAMGVKTAEKDEPLILNFGETLSRLGHVVLWPRLKLLDEGVSLPEDPDTFITAFEYLEKQDFVDKNRISFVGFSVGSSIALVAAEDPGISDKIHSLIFFGGYYDIFDYLENLASKSMIIDGKRVSWEPSEGAVNHFREILETKKAGSFEMVVKEKPSPLRDFSPKENIGNFKARIFILHEVSDSYVPYAESIKLSNNLSKDVQKTYLLANLFEHVQPKKSFSLETLKEFLNLYGFVAQVFRHL